MKFRLFDRIGRDKEGNPPDAVSDDIRDVMRRVYTSQDGIKLLKYQLYDWGYFTICKTPEQQIMRNYATKFLSELGNLMGVEIWAELKVGGK